MLKSFQAYLVRKTKSIDAMMKLDLTKEYSMKDISAFLMHLSIIFEDKDQAIRIFNELYFTSRITDDMTPDEKRSIHDRFISIADFDEALSTEDSEDLEVSEYTRCIFDCKRDLVSPLEFLRWKQETELMTILSRKMAEGINYEFPK